jgi:hypothetical protein
MTMFHRTNNILKNIPHIQTECGGIFCKILLVPQNTVMDLYNVMQWLKLSMELSISTIGPHPFFLHVQLARPINGIHATNNQVSAYGSSGVEGRGLSQLIEI